MSTTLNFQGSIVVLPSPDFGNQEDLSFDRINSKSRGGDLIVYRDPNWTHTITLKLKFSFITQSKANTLILFIKRSLGQQITLTDWEGFTWTGIISTPAGEVVQESLSNITATFEFVGGR